VIICFTISVIIRHFANAHPALVVVKFSWEKNKQSDQKKQEFALLKDSFEFNFLFYFFYCHY